MTIAAWVFEATEPADAVHHGLVAEIVGQTVDPQRLAITVPEDGCGDRVLVDVEADPEDGGTMR